MNKLLFWLLQFILFFLIPKALEIVNHPNSYPTYWCHSLSHPNGTTSILSIPSKLHLEMWNRESTVWVYKQEQRGQGLCETSLWLSKLQNSPRFMHPWIFQFYLKAFPKRIIQGLNNFVFTKGTKGSNCRILSNNRNPRRS